MGVYTMHDVLSAFMWFSLGFTFAQLVDICEMELEDRRRKKKMEGEQ